MWSPDTVPTSGSIQFVSTSSIERRMAYLIDWLNTYQLVKTK